MKTVDFFYLIRRLIKPILVGFLMCYALPAVAAPPTAEDFNKSSKLVLTLSDKWLEPNVQNSLRKSNRPSIGKSPAENTKAKDAPIGCGMDVTPLASSDASFGNRLVGKCNLTLHY
ncbi:hypothetical protein [Methylomonas methanica]|uniref:Uncharacterized protein n=1 Tax=Methylomonas methanica (strain DSM 25384 / MC09) TaxID=857087 RepID=G0A088_METMM|nr:hypothetical protein [Methylomonas methanica]AEG02394.1 hypothetical protein Metme_4041 [Methylomonas methanica MC09]